MVVAAESKIPNVIINGVSNNDRDERNPDVYLVHLYHYVHLLNRYSHSNLEVNEKFYLIELSLSLPLSLLMMASLSPIILGTLRKTPRILKNLGGGEGLKLSWLHCI